MRLWIGKGLGAPLLNSNVKVSYKRRVVPMPSYRPELLTCLFNFLFAVSCELDFHSFFYSCLLLLHILAGMIVFSKSRLS